MIIPQKADPVRPSVLLVDRDDARRKFLTDGLAHMSYEAIPAAQADEGAKLAAGLGASVVVISGQIYAELDDDAREPFDAQRDEQHNLLLLGSSEHQDLAPDDALFLGFDGLSDGEILVRLRLVLVGMEVGVEPDENLETLVGDLSMAPLPGLVRMLNKCSVTGLVDMEDGWVAMERGKVVSSRIGKIQSSKAFCRLARRTQGPFHIRLGPQDVTHNIGESFDELLVRSLEEAQLDIPHPHTRIQVLGERAPDIDPRITTHHNLLLTLVGQCSTVGELLDAMPATDGRVLQALNKMVRHGSVALEKPRAEVTVITDSTCDLPPQLARDHDIEVVPLSILFGDEALRDGVDITPRDFYGLLATSDEHPSTRPPAEAEFFEHFHHIIEEQDIVSVHISEKLSQTVVHARQAVLRGAKDFNHLERPNPSLEVIDTRSVSMGVGLMALFAARMGRRGEKVYAINRRLHQMTRRVHVLFVVNTLDYLLRGGRIGKAQAVVGKMLGIKPILGVVDGEVAAVSKVRGGRKAHPKIVELFKELVDPKKPVVVSVAHAQAPKWADRLRKLMEKSFDVAELIMSDIGPVVGTHAGPGCVGAVVFQPTEEEWELIKPLDDES